jgi:hypothetical protein
MFSRPQPVYHQPNSHWPGIIKLLPAKESLVGDIPAWEGKTANLFLQCTGSLDSDPIANKLISSSKQFLDPDRLKFVAKQNIAILVCK